MVTKTLEDIPGVGPAIAEKLREAGYNELMASLPLKNSQRRAR